MVVPTLVVTEVVYVVASRLGVAAEVKLLGDFAAGALLAEPVVAPDGLLMALVGRRLRGRHRRATGVRDVATLDRRHFTVVRPAHAFAFELLP